MAMETTVTALSAYHNYKLDGVLRKEIRQGSEGDMFFLHALEVAHPAAFPRISANLFSAKGAPIASIRGNAVERLAGGYREERDGDGMAVLDASGNAVFRYRVKRYQNVYVTEISGEFFDEKGRPVTL